MGKDYIPLKENEIAKFARNFKEKILESPGDFSLSRAEVKRLVELVDKFDENFSKHKTAHAAAKAAYKKKIKAKKSLIAEIRTNARKIQGLDVPDEKIASLGLTVREKTRKKVGVPKTIPVVTIDTSEPLRHTIRYVDSKLEGKGKPQGIHGVEVFVKIGGEATLEQNDYRYLATNTSSPYKAKHVADDVGKQAHYLLRWVNSKGEAGAWCKVESATVTG